MRDRVDKCACMVYLKTQRTVQFERRGCRWESHIKINLKRNEV
jgi:hypothetical protein